MVDDEKPDGQRRVYVLPNELYERIVKFQEDKGYPSEVEAVRRLLDEALKSRDDIHMIVSRFLDRLKVNKIAHEVAKDVLVGHPLVKEISFDGEAIMFRVKGDDREVRILPTGEAYQRIDSREPWLSWETGYIPF